RDVGFSGQHGVPTSGVAPFTSRGAAASVRAVRTGSYGSVQAFADSAEAYERLPYGSSDPGERDPPCPDAVRDDGGLDDGRFDGVDPPAVGERGGDVLPRHPVRPALAGLLVAE